MGTPKTLKEAIDNGMNEWLIYLEWTPSDQIKQTASDIIKKHVKDFAAQKFGAKMLIDDSKTLKDLYELFE